MVPGPEFLAPRHIDPRAAFNSTLTDKPEFLLFSSVLKFGPKNPFVKHSKAGICSGRLDKTKSNVMDASTKSSRVRDGATGGEARQFPRHALDPGNSLGARPKSDGSSGADGHVMP